MVAVGESRLFWQIIEAGAPEWHNVKDRFHQAFITLRNPTRRTGRPPFRLSDRLITQMYLLSSLGIKLAITSGRCGLIKGTSLLNLLCVL